MDLEQITSALQDATAALKGVAAIQSARSRKKTVQLNKRLAAAQAKEEFALSQRSAMEEERQARLLASRALAVAAAGGGSVGDPTVANLIADISGEGAYRAGLELYKGRTKARATRQQAALDAFTEEQQAISERSVGISALAQSGASIYERYWGKGKKP